MSRLITATLFNSINWYENCPENWKEKAHRDLKNMLARIWTTPNPAAKRGMDFEKILYNTLILNKEDKVKCSDEFKKIMKACKGGVFQKKIKKYIEISNVEYCLFGKIDVWFDDVIKDIKTTGNYKGRMNYLKGMQHKLYCYIEHTSNFEYVIAEFLGDSNTIHKVHTIPYEVDYWDKLEDEIINKIKKTITFLGERKELFELYKNKYSLY